MKRYILFLLLITACSLKAAYTVKDGKFVNKNELPSKSVQEHFSAILETYNEQNWKELVKQAAIINKNFSNTPFALETVFYLGVAYFHLQELELANKEFSNYLKQQTTPKHFEEAIHYKFQIAEQFQKGAKKHLLGLAVLPQWVPAKEEAIAIYDEVISALPHHDLAAHSLYGKGAILLEEEDYRASIEAFQTLIRRFPKHSLAVESFVAIGDVYLIQCKQEYPDQDYLDLAEINLRKFRESFPREEKLLVAEEKFRRLRELYAKNLYEIAQFFSRTKKKEAALIYFRKIISTYPDTQIAKRSKEHIVAIEAQLKEIENKKNKIKAKRQS